MAENTCDIRNCRRTGEKAEDVQCPVLIACFRRKQKTASWGKRQRIDNIEKVTFEASLKICKACRNPAPVSVIRQLSSEFMKLIKERGGTPVGRLALAWQSPKAAPPDLDLDKDTEFELNLGGKRVL